MRTDKKIIRGRLSCQSSTKEPRNGHLTFEQEEKNTNVSSDRITIENFFGRIYMLWRLMATKYRWSHDSSDLFLSAAVAFTNFYIACKPLREGHVDVYCHPKIRQYTCCTDASRRRAARLKGYRQCRNDRLNMPLRARYRDLDLYSFY